MEYCLETQALCKTYGRFRAVDNLSMHVPRGAIYGFVGKNGAGKTTLLRLICGLQRPTAGGYCLYGVPHTDKALCTVRRRMGAVVETPSIYMDLPAQENLKQQYRVLGLPSFSGIPALLELVGLQDTGRKKARHFSLGMRQRLGIAMALAGDPDFLVLDEPTNGLDPQGIIEVRELILKLNREFGITVLISSHILGELSKLATHYGFIDGGRIRAADRQRRAGACARAGPAGVRVPDRFRNAGGRLRHGERHAADARARGGGLRGRLDAGARRKPRELLCESGGRCAP